MKGSSYRMNMCRDKGEEEKMDKGWMSVFRGVRWEIAALHLNV